MHPKIFVSYNPGVEIEQSTALRLQTLSSLYGATIYLPDRLGTNVLKETTKQKIADSQIFVMFSTQQLMKNVQEEVNYALQLAKRVVIFYDARVGKNLNTAQNANLIETTFDPFTEDAASIMKKAMDLGGFQDSSGGSSNANNGLSAVVGIGLGLFLLWALTKEDD